MNGISKLDHHENILIIDDEPDVIDLVKRKLERFGYVVDTATNGIDGLNIVHKHALDLIATDLTMPGMDGYSVCQELKKSQSTAHIPIIIFSANGNVEDICKEVGADDFLIKPFDSQQMTDKIEIVLKRVTAPPLVTNVLIAGNNRVDCKRLVERFMEYNWNLNIKMIKQDEWMKDEILKMNVDILFMDILMPGNRSPEIIKFLRLNPSLKQMKIFTYTSFTKSEINFGPNLDLMQTLKNACTQAGASFMGPLTKASLFLVLYDSCP